MPETRPRGAIRTQQPAPASEVGKFESNPEEANDNRDEGEWQWIESKMTRTDIPDQGLSPNDVKTRILTAMSPPQGDSPKLKRGHHAPPEDIMFQKPPLRMAEAPNTLGSVQLQDTSTNSTIFVPQPSNDPRDPLNW